MDGGEGARVSRARLGSVMPRGSGGAGVVDVRLREVEPADLPVFFAHQADAEAAALVGLPSRDRAAFDAHWWKILHDERMRIRTILADGAVAGNVLYFERDGERLVGYWLGREHWGRGVATRALALFLALVPERPLRAHVTPRNAASRRVLEKCGFVLVGAKGAGGDALLVLELAA